MDKKNKDSIRIQVTITGKAAWLYKNISKGLRSKAIEIGLKLLATDSKLMSIFFDDVDMVVEILKVDTKKTEPIIEPIIEEDVIESNTENSNQFGDKDRFDFAKFDKK